MADEKDFSVKVGTVVEEFELKKLHYSVCPMPCFVKRKENF